MKSWQKLVRRHPELATAIPYEIALLMTIGTFFFRGGEDLHRFYIPLAEGCLNCALNPWHSSWILFPLRFIPPRLAWPLVTAATCLVLIWACRRLNTNPIPVLLAFPTFGVVWLGQVDAVVVGGLVLALTSPNPYLRGAGLLLMSIKPQVSGLVILYLLWRDKDRLRTLIIPAAVAILSVIVWGPLWPLEWLQNRGDIGLPVWGTAAIFPYGLVAFLAVPLMTSTREKITAILLATALSMPWFGVYSYVAFLPLLAPGWAAWVSYAWVLAYPWLGNKAVMFAFALPAALLVYLVWPHLREKLALKYIDAPDQPEDSPD